MGARFARSAGCRCGLFASTSAIQTINVSSNARGVGTRTPVAARRSNRRPVHPRARLRRISVERRGRRCALKRRYRRHLPPPTIHPHWVRIPSSRKPPRSTSSTTNARELRMRSQDGTSDLSRRTSWWGLVRTLRAAIFSCWPEPRERRYRPELHYMRGPGPKWRAKHRQFD